MNRVFAAALLALAWTAFAAAQDPAATIEVTRAELRDRIYGGWVGMLIGGLEGLPHEFKYRDEPRDALPEFTFLAARAPTTTTTASGRTSGSWIARASRSCPTRAWWRSGRRT